MRTEDNTHEKFEKNIWDICWCSATCNCINNDQLFFGNFRSSCLNVFEKQHHSFLPSPKIMGVFLVFQIWTNRGVIKNFSEIGGLVERGFLLERRGFPNCFIHFPPEKHVFTTVGYFLSGKLFMLVVINRSILSCHLLFTRK